MARQGGRWLGCAEVELQRVQHMLLNVGDSGRGTRAPADSSRAAARFNNQRASVAPATACRYTHTLCPYAERAWLALLEKGARFDLCHIDLSNKPGWYRKVNPRGLVPAVQDEAGSVHVESIDICRRVVPGGT